MGLPPLKGDAPDYPAWAVDIGAKLKEDKGGKYYEMAHEVVTKVYVYPVFKVEQVNAFVRRPYGYKGKKKSRADNAKPAVEEEKVETVKPKVEEW